MNSTRSYRTDLEPETELNRPRILYSYKGEKMPTYNVVFCGKLPVWPKDWDVGKSVKLIDCEFEKIDYASNDNVSVEVVVEADDEDEASEIGRQKCLVECDLFRLCYGYPIRLDFVHIQVDELSNSGRSYFSAGTVWAVDPKKFIA